MFTAHAMAGKTARRNSEARTHVWIESVEQENFGNGHAKVSRKPPGGLLEAFWDHLGKLVEIQTICPGPRNMWSV